jgi:hypothetical protein
MTVFSLPLSVLYGDKPSFHSAHTPAQIGMSFSFLLW